MSTAHRLAARGAPGARTPDAQAKPAADPGEAPKDLEAFLGH